MKNKKLLSLVILAVVALLAVIVYAIEGNVFSTNDIIFGVSSTASTNNFTANISGTTNLTVNLRNNVSIYPRNTSVVNVSIEWVFALYENGSNDVDNHSVMRTTTIQNYSPNNTTFQLTFDTTVLPDGFYNVTVSAFNVSNEDQSQPLSQTINVSIMNVTVDNTKPNGTNVMSSLGVAGAQGLSINFTRFNTSLNGALSSDVNTTFNVTVREQLSGVKSVFIEFFYKRNATGFNLSGSNNDVGNNVVGGNRSGYYSTPYNVSKLRGGTWGLRAYTTDQSGNINITPPVTFSVNGQINVTHNSTSASTNSGGFYSVLSDNQTFVVSIANDTRQPATAQGANSQTITRVLLVFDKVSGDGSDPLNYPNATMVAAYDGSLNVSPSTQIVNFTASYNVSNLTEGRYQLRIFAEDGFGNFNYTENITVIVDKTNPTVSVTCTPSEPQVGETVSCTCTATDGLSGIRTTGVFAGGGSSESTTASSVGGVTSSLCSATDNSKNKGTATGTFTVVEATDGGGSSAGGSSGGSSSGSSGAFGQRTWSSLNAGEVAVVDVTDKSVGVTKVSFGVTATSYGGWVRVSKRDNAPLTAEAFSKKMYKVVEITTSTALKESDINNRKIDFRVEKSWLQTNSVAAADVTLYRLVNNEWVALAATVGQDDGTNVHYSATTPGFSFFLIGEKGQGATAPAEGEAMEGTTPGTTAPGEEDAAEGGSMTKGGMSTATIVIIVLVVLAAAAAVWYFFGRNKDEE